MKVWVSGAAGKLGAEVVRQLLAAGHQVVPVDRRGDDVDLVDLERPDQVAASMTGCDAVVHCAAIPAPVGVEPADLVRNNTMSTFNALEEAWKTGIRTAVLASSGSIYGTAWSPDPISQPYLPVDEESPLQYVDPYALSKDFLETMGRMYARRGMIITALRFHWILTEDEVRDLVRQLSIADEAKNLWGYVDLGDAARACLASLTRDGSDDRYQALVIASDRTRVDEPIEELLAEHFPEVEQRVRLTGQQGAYDCSRAERVIGWRPQSDWRAGR